MKRLASILAATALAAPIGCTDDTEDFLDGETVKSEDGKADTSALAMFIDLEFEGKLVTDFSFDNRNTIEDQLLYTVGQLNGFTAVGRVDKTEITNIKKTTVGGKTQITYTAKLPVAWKKSNGMPTTVELKLPIDISSSGQTAFADKYKEDCVDFAAHDVDAGSMFYYYRPKASGCKIEDADVHTVQAAATPSPTQTTGMFPEYNKVWEDGTLEVLAIFGKFEDGATSGDAGIDAYNEFIGEMKRELGAGTTTIPASIPSSPGVAMPDIEFTATRPDGRKIHVVALMTDNVTTGLSETAFRSRYETASTKADFIVYNGHAGLGTNVRALAQAGKWVQGQYVIVYMNGCDTFAYIDDALFNSHKAVNPDDTTGFKYIDIVNNAMPAFFHSMSGASMSMFRGLLDNANPKTYEQIFRGIDSSQVVLVSGEQDNAFTPGGGGTPSAWAGLADKGTLKRSETKKWSTPVVDAGRYTFAITGSSGDADLYVRVGTAPTLAKFDCRPFKTGSNESCTVTLAQPAPIHVMVNGFSATSFDITGKKN
jgi:hypothetical protein